MRPEKAERVDHLIDPIAPEPVELTLLPRVGWRRRSVEEATSLDAMIRCRARGLIDAIVEKELEAALGGGASGI